uniref:GDP-perosamine synthase n=1 Tax=Schlesneria paludicola TaxID=360056 RepID=A0A7C2P4J0_9PLAN
MSTTSDAAERIPLSVPVLTGREGEYIQECLDTNWVSSGGPFVDRFEREFAAYVGTRHAVATVNGTAALHTAMVACGIQPDDEVLVSSLTFIATANAVRYANAHPVFIDAEPKHWQMDPELVEEFLTHDCVSWNGRLVNRRTGRPVTAILPVHVLGHPADLSPLLELARRFDLTLIEDAAESLGATYRGRRVGQFGAFGCFSFNGNKTITTGGGGMLTTNDDRLAALAKHLTTQAKDDPDDYIHNRVGFNYRMPNILAAFGCAQLEQLDRYLEAKRTIAGRYRDLAATTPGLTLQPESPEVFHTYWLSTVEIDAAQFGRSMRTVRADLRRANIESRPLWQPLHLSPAHRGAQALVTGVSERLYERCLSLPSSVNLTAVQQERVLQELASGRGQAARAA